MPFIFVADLEGRMENSTSGKHFFAVGISYRTADLETRGLFSLGSAQCDALLEEAKSLGISELLINTTCNRTELYSYTESPNVLIKLLCKHSKGKSTTFDSLGYIYKNKAAIHHIFKVGTGLDSQILGDFEIIGQLKQGFYRSKKKGLVNGLSERLINAVIQASKRIKNETNISSGATSVAFASVQYILKHIDQVSQKNILLFGTGKIGRNTCENLIKHTENDHIVLINRTHEKAQDVAGRFNVNVKPYGELPSEIRKADVMVVATGAQHPTISKDLIHTDKPLLILDLSIPNNVHSNVSQLEHVRVVNLDALSQITQETLEERKKHLPDAEQILEEVKAEFMEWLNHRKYAPSLRALKEKLSAQQAMEIKNQSKKKTLSEDASSVSQQMIQKITGQLANYLRENPSKATETLAVFEDVFQLPVNEAE